MVQQLSRSDLTRVWLVENRAGPANRPMYQGMWKAGSITWPQGSPETIRMPDPDEYGKFIVADKIPGEKGDPGLTITALYQMDLSALLRMIRRNCPIDLQIHMGKCKDPQNFNEGWEKIMVLEAAMFGDYSIADLGALSPDERSLVNEESPFTGVDLYEIVRIVFEEQAATEVVQEIIAIMVCDAISCGECELPSDGCEKVFALTLSNAGSPGLPAEVIFSDDSGVTWDDTLIDTLAAAQDPTDMACVGPRLVVISNVDNALHYATLSEILLGTEIWVRMPTGFQGGGEPNAIWSGSPRHTWIVGDGGYVYFLPDPTDVINGVTVQDAGIVTGEILTAIHGYDILNVVAVGVNNAVIVTRNGGDTWALVVGPEVNITLNCVWMKGENEWWIGTQQGRLWYTRDGGTTWVEKWFPGTTTGQVRDIKFSTPTVGWMAHDNDTPLGRILRTIDGGHSWYVAPEGNTAIPANDRINEVAVCSDPNVVWGGGLADNLTDGFITKGS